MAERHDVETATFRADARRWGDRVTSLGVEDVPGALVVSGSEYHLRPVPLLLHAKSQVPLSSFVLPDQYGAVFECKLGADVDGAVGDA